jgi:hypothetical protein
MTFVPQSSNQGALFELVARGQKDTFFSVDRESSLWAFNNDYDSSAPFLYERRTTVPLNAPLFGNTFEVEIDKYGDILTDCSLLVELPTWLPPLPTQFGGVPTEPGIANALHWIRDASGVSYGYTNYIGYFLFEKIQFYQDQILLQEWSGDALMALSSTEGSWNSTFLDQATAGMTAPTDRLMASRATPRLIRLRLPLPGLQTPGDGGFPLCCLPSQNYRFRIKLRPLEHLVVCSDPSIIKPAPWNVPEFQYTFQTGQTYRFAPIDRNKIGQPTIMLETSQAYVPDDVKTGLQTRTLTIPFRKVFENIFTMGELDYVAIDRGGTAQVTRRLDARHMAERAVFFFRTAQAIDRNDLSDFINPIGGGGGSFYTNLKLVIAGRDREHSYGDLVWRDLQAHAKDERDNGLNIGEMRWNLGDVFERERPSARQPEGAVNFSTADRPTLHIQLQNVPVQITTGQRNTEMRVFIESWTVYEIQEGRGRQLFGA